MIFSPVTPGEGLSQQPAEPRKDRWSWPPLWRRVALAVILLVSGFMNFYQLGQDGYANGYYAAGIRSMLDSWHNFFFVSFDPGGFVTIDKPPLGFWIQAASAKILGFSPFSILAPQALAGVLSVLLLYILVKRHCGVTAALLAALALAISPISVVTSRNNTIDSTLILVLLLGAWTVMRAAETGRLRWLLLCAVCIGLGFNIKMMEAYLVIPAFGLVYLLAAPRRVWVRLAHLTLAALLLLALSLAWVVAVDLTPASQRPYVGSTQDNSELSLAIGYNGIQRLLGSSGGGGGNSGNASRQRPARGTQEGAPGGYQPGSSNNNGPLQGFPGGNGEPPQGFPGGAGLQGGPAGNGGGNAGGMFNTGSPGPLRLFNEPLGGQIVWLLPLALLGMLALAWQWKPASSEEPQPATVRGRLARFWRRRPRLRQDQRQQSLIIWGVWLLTMGIFFSVAGFFHQYYLSTLAPAVCALFGIGVVVMWQDYRRSGWRGWLLPFALALTALEQIHIIASNPDWGTWLIPIIAITCVIAALALIVARLLPRLLERKHLFLPALGLALAGLLITSAVWSAVPGLQNIAADLPAAGPTVSGMGSGGGGNGLNVNTALIRYLEANRGSAKYLVAVDSSQEADSIILATNEPVMALGGFTGSDPILTTSELAKLVANGTIRFFLINGAGAPGAGGGGPGGNRQGSITGWVAQHCSLVSSSQYMGSNAGGQLYSCQASS
jgi:4-amino-4-deoxy-L-arabinose transferase-like glycosyltransferase